MTPNSPKDEHLKMRYLKKKKESQLDKGWALKNALFQEKTRFLGLNSPMDDLKNGNSWKNSIFEWIESQLPKDEHLKMQYFKKTKKKRDFFSLNSPKEGWALKNAWI